MNIFIEKEKRNIEVDFEDNVRSLLKKLGINPEEVLVVRGNVILTSDVKLKNSDSIKLLPVVSGG